MIPPERTPVVVAARRTAIGEVGGALRNVPAERLAAPLFNAVLTDAAWPEVTEVLLGNTRGPGGNIARVAALEAGLGHGVTAMTVDRQCASGLSAIVTAADLISAGAGQAYLAGGVESASTAPWRAWRPRNANEPPRFYSRAPFAPAHIGDPDMGPAADALSARAGISRRRQDEFAARSHERAVRARQSGRCDAELVTVSGVRVDERPREGFSPERLARFRPAFTVDGTATAANSCGVADGAAVALVTSEQVRSRLGLPGIRLLDRETVGVDPNELGIAAAPAMRNLLRRNGDSSADETLPATVEFNEAFAGQLLACMDEVGIDERRVCPDGGAIALGHPWGASGAVLVVRLFHRMLAERGPATGMAALSSGGGLGVATLWERVR